MSDRIQNVHEKWYNGCKYRSTLEADTAEVLDLLGIPFSYEPWRITLLDGFSSPFQKEKVRSITYKPDFILGDIIIECKGYETPEWKLKKKLLFKYLQEKEPNLLFYQVHNARGELMEVLDKHWLKFGLAIEVTPENPKFSAETKTFDSVSQAMQELGLRSKRITPILYALMGKRQHVYKYSWKLIKLKL